MPPSAFFDVISLDDFLIYISESERDCWRAFWEPITLLERLGLTVNWNEEVYPCQRLTYQGIEVDNKLSVGNLGCLITNCEKSELFLSQTLAKSKFTK